MRPLNSFKCFLPESGSAPGMEQDKFAAAVFRPGGLVMARVNRFVFAVADGPDARGVHADLGQRLAQRQRAAFAERAVVFLRATLVTMTFDEQLGACIPAQ